MGPTCRSYLMAGLQKEFSTAAACARYDMEQWRKSTRHGMTQTVSVRQTHKSCNHDPFHCCRTVLGLHIHMKCPGRFSLKWKRCSRLPLCKSSPCEEWIYGSSLYSTVKVRSRYRSDYQARTSVNLQLSRWMTCSSTSLSYLVAALAGDVAVDLSDYVLYLA